MTTLVLVEHDGAEPDELSLQALAFARRLGAPVEAVLAGGADAAARLPVAVAHVAELDGGYAPAAWAAAVAGLAGRVGAGAVVAAGSDRANEVLAHVAARLEQPFAANCIDVLGAGPVRVLRQRWGGSLLEEARVHGAPALLSVAPHAVAADEAPGTARVEPFAPVPEPADLVVRVSETVDEAGGGVSLAEAKIVVSGGRGVGSAEGFAIIEELAGLLGGAVGCSRVVTSAGWRPHADQVGQTGTKISPDLYIACGISGATQHIAGCKGAKKLLAINADPEAPILASADYAVIGDLHEIVPAISAELRKARGT
jgi:electron transfer flavoprotein alpha subunit